MIGLCAVWIATCFVAVYLSVKEAHFAWDAVFPPNAIVHITATGNATTWDKIWYLIENEVDSEVMMLWIVSAVLVISLAVTLRSFLTSPVSRLGRRGYRLNRKTGQATQSYDRNEIPQGECVSAGNRFLGWMYRACGSWYVRYHDHHLVFSEEEDLARVHNDGKVPLEDVIHQTYFPDNCNYVFGYHPHGVLGHGFWATFHMRYFPSKEELSAKEVQHTAGTPYHSQARRKQLSVMRRFMHKYVVHGADVQDSDFPQRKFLLTGHTLFSNFVVPVWREFILFLGFRDVSKEALLNCLTPVANDTHMRRMCALVPGGAVESLDCTEPGKLAIKSRKGFVKLCVQTGSSVVPVYSFGETEVWSDLLPEGLVSHGTVRKVQIKLQKLLTFALPLVKGRYGLPFPKNHRITTVVGKPIKCTLLSPKDPKFIEEVSRVHDIYIAELSDIYRRFQPVFDPSCKHHELRI